MKKYKVIYADPPWAYKVWSKKGAGRSAESHYPTMDIAAIKALPVGELADKDCALFLWITFPMLREAWGVMDAWGLHLQDRGLRLDQAVPEVGRPVHRHGLLDAGQRGDLPAGDPRTPEAGGAGCEAGHPLPRGAAQPEAGGGAAADRSPHGGRAPY